MKLEIIRQDFKACLTEKELERAFNKHFMSFLKWMALIYLVFLALFILTKPLVFEWITGEPFGHAYTVEGAIEYMTGTPLAILVVNLVLLAAYFLLMVGGLWLISFSLVKSKWSKGAL